MGTTVYTAVNCIDRRTQLPHIHWLSTRFEVEQVDLVTKAGPVKALAIDLESSEAMSIYLGSNPRVLDQNPGIPP